MSLTQVVSLHNVENCEAFVQHCMNKAKGIVLTKDQREDLLAEGLCLLVELAAKYDPAKDKSARTASKTEGFYGYALFLLPKKLSDAWHRGQEHHLLKTQPDGKRKYEYASTAKSLDEYLQNGNDGMEPIELSANNCREPGDFVKAAA